MELFSCVFLLLALSSTCSGSGLRLLFPEEKQYSYLVKGKVSTSSLTPSDPGTSWSLDGRLYLRPYHNHTHIRYKLLLSKGFMSHQTQEPTKYLQEPWEAEYKENGYISNLYVGNEPLWVTNMKRAISINFQFKTETGTFEDEPCLYAKCVVTYIPDGTRIRKYNSLQYSSVLTEKMWSSVPLIMYSENSQHSDTISSAERVYELDWSGLASLETRGIFHYKTHHHVLAVTTELSFSFDTTTPAPTRSVEKMNLTKTSVQYEAPDSTDPSASIRNRSQNELRNSTYEILFKIATKGIDSNNIVKNATIIHSLDFINLLNTMNQLTYPSFEKLFEDMVLGTSYDVETSKNIFLEVLPHIRTNAAARFVKYLLMEQKKRIEDATLLSLLRKLPFNVANLSQELLQELEVFTKLSLDFPQEIRHAGILSFATLAHKTNAAWRVKQDYFDNIVVKYFRMYSDCPQYVDRLIWLQGLCNLGFSADSYMRIVYADGWRDRHERIWAALGIRQNYVPILETTFPILTNDSESIQLRIAALHTFLSSEVRANDFMYVHNYIKYSNNNQLKKFWYSTIKSLEGASGFYGYRTVGDYVPFVVNQLTDPDYTFWATNNYIISNQDRTSGAALQVLSIGDPVSGLPTFGALKVGTGGERPLDATIFIIIEGVYSNVFRQVRTINPDELNLEKLQKILKQIQVEIINHEEVHIDIVMKIHDFTVFATHINKLKFINWTKDDTTMSLADFLWFSSHINQQIVYYPYQMDMVVPTELGTPTRLQKTIASFTSIRGSFTAESTNEFIRRNDMHIRYQGTSVTSLSTEGPLLKSEHAARIQRSFVAHLPIEFDFKLLYPYAAKFIWKNPGGHNGGIAMHSRTQMFMESDKEKRVYTISTGKQKLSNDDDGLFFDCEKTISSSMLSDKFWSPNSRSLEIITSLQPSQMILNGVQLLMAPPFGSCGVVIPPKPIVLTGDNILELSINNVDISLLVGQRPKLEFTHSLEFRETKPEGKIHFSVNGNTLYQGFNENSSLEVSINGVENPNTEAKKTWNLCLVKQDTSHTSFDQDITLNPGLFESQVTVGFSTENITDNCPNSKSQLRLEYKRAPVTHRDNFERNFEFKMFGKEFPKVDKLAEAIFGKNTVNHLFGNLNQQINISAVIKENNGEATMKMNEENEVQFNSGYLPLLLDSTMQVMRKFGLYRECRIQESTVTTVSKTVDKLPAIPNGCSESLVLADCSDPPRFAIFRLKSGGIKVYTGGQYVTISGDATTVTINGDRGCDGECEYPVEGDARYINGTYDFKVTRLGNTVKVHSKLSGVHVYHKEEETVVLVPFFYMKTSCGSCKGQHYHFVC